MENEIILLDNAATALDDLKVLLSGRDKAIFMVLGNSTAHFNLAKTAQARAVEFRFVVHITVPEAVLTLLTDLPNTSETTLPANEWFAICLQFDNTIIEVYGNDDPDNIVPCFMLASN